MTNFLKKHKKTFTYHIPLLLLSILLTLIAIYLLFLKNKTSPNQTASQSCQDCNVILISVDTLRYDRLGINGYTKKTSPNIDKFFKDGVIFENAYAPAPWTLPSHSAMLTGIYPKKLNIEITTDPLPEEATTIAEILLENDYQAAAFSTGAFITREQGFGQGFEFFDKTQNWQDAQNLAEKTNNWLEDNKGKKFFLFLHSFHIHDPYSPAEKFIKELDPNYAGNLNSFDISQIVKLNKGELKLPQTDLERISALYDAEIAELDDNLGKIFDQIKNLELDKNTVVILTSDHGEEFGERDSWGIHAYSLYDELVRVPLIIKTPNFQPKRISNLAELTDIFPTVLELLAIEKPANLDGQSLVASSNNQNRTIFAETSITKMNLLDFIEEGEKEVITGSFTPKARKENTKIPKAKMVRLGNYKLIQNFDGSFELYNLESDPSEKNNIAESKQDIVQKLQNYIRNF